MKPILKITFILLVLVFVANTVYAQGSIKRPAPLKLLITTGLELGGDKVADVYFTNGEQQSVRAGQGISVGVGAQLQIPGVERFLLRSTVGIKYVTTAADNAHIRLTRIPIVVTGNIMATPKLRFGAGLSMHGNIQFKTDGLGGDYTLRPAQGPTFEVAYAGVGLTYTAMQYKDQVNQSYSANAIGLSFSLTIPNR